MQYLLPETLTIPNKKTVKKLLKKADYSTSSSDQKSGFSSQDSSSDDGNEYVKVNSVYSDRFASDRVPNSSTKGFANRSINRPRAKTPKRGTDSSVSRNKKSASGSQISVSSNSTNQTETSEDTFDSGSARGVSRSSRNPRKSSASSSVTKKSSTKSFASKYRYLIPFGRRSAFDADIAKTVNSDSSCSTTCEVGNRKKNDKVKENFGSAAKIKQREYDLFDRRVEQSRGLDEYRRVRKKQLLDAKQELRESNRRLMLLRASEVSEPETTTDDAEDKVYRRFAVEGRTSHPSNRTFRRNSGLSVFSDSLNEEDVTPRYGTSVTGETYNLLDGNSEYKRDRRNTNILFGDNTATEDGVSGVSSSSAAGRRLLASRRTRLPRKPTRNHVAFTSNPSHGGANKSRSNSHGTRTRCLLPLASDSSLNGYSSGMTGILDADDIIRQMKVDRYLLGDYAKTSGSPKCKSKKLCKM